MTAEERLNEELDPRSSEAHTRLVYGESEDKQKKEGKLLIQEGVEQPEYGEDKLPPGPATGTQFEDPKKGSTVEIPRHDPPAHQRPVDLDPRVNGPFLDEINEEHARLRREVREQHVGNNE